MTANPDMVAGPGNFDTELMTVGKGLILTKRGAEGYQAISLLPGACGKDSPACGITLKVSDGDLAERDREVKVARIAHNEGGRARATVSVEVLRQLGALDKTQLVQLASYLPRPQYNWRHIQVGEIRPCFQLTINK
jgi:L-asparaginase